MANKRLLVAILVITLVTFFATPFSAFAVKPDAGSGDTGTSIHVKDMLKGDVSILSAQVEFTDSTTPVALTLLGGNWETDDLELAVLTKVKGIYVTFSNGEDSLYLWPDDFGPQGKGVVEPMEYSAEGVTKDIADLIDKHTGSVNFWLNYIKGESFPALVIDKKVQLADSTADPVDELEIVTVPQDVTYYFDVTNTGNVDLTDVTVTDEDIPWTSDGQDIAAGDTAQFTTTVTITAEMLVDDEFENTASASSVYDDEPVVSNEDSALVYLTYSLEVIKDVVDVEGADIDDDTEFTFYLYEWGADVEEDDPVAGPITVSEGNPGVFEGLASGLYYVYEEDKYGYTPYGYGGAGSPEMAAEIGMNGTDSITFSNIKDPGETYDLTINKNVLDYDLTDIEHPMEFTFDVYTAVTNSSMEWVKGELVAEDVPASETTPGSVEGLLAGMFIVEEDPMEGCTASEASILVEIGDELDNEVNFINIMDPPATLTVYKHVDREVDSDVVFTFDIWSVIPQSEEDPEWVTSVTASAIDPAVIELEPGTYVVTERDNVPNFEFDATYEETGEEYVTLESGESDDVGFFNAWIEDEEELGTLTIRKNVPNVTNSRFEFSFTIVGPDYENSFTLSESDGPVTFQDLAFGEYTIYEENESGYREETLSQTIVLGPNDSSATVTFVNTRNTTNDRDRDTPDEPTIVIEEPTTPAAPAVVPVVVLDQPVPAAPLPQTGGFDPLFLYGLGALLASGGAAMKRRKK